MSRNRDFLNEQSKESVERFYSKIYQIISEDIVSRKFQCPAGSLEPCFNVRVGKKAYETTVRQVDASVNYADEQGNQVCLALPLVQGFIDCKYWMRDGLRAEVEEVAALKGRRLTTFQSKKELSWEVDETLIPDASSPHVKSFSKVAYTIWVRLMKALLSNRESATAWIKPKPLPFFQHSRAEWLIRYQDFDISRHLSFDEAVRKVGQSCEPDKPIIDYKTCSSSYNSLFFSAGSAFDKFARKRGAPIVQPGTALLWPGLSLAHHLGQSVPAWSRSRRPLREVFGKWIFNTTVQCDTGSVESSVCADDPYRQENTVAVVPWLSGDYNPWYVAVCVIVNERHSGLCR